MRRVSAFAMVPLALGMLSSGCDSDPTGPAPLIEALPRPLTAVEQQLVSASNVFGLELFRRVHATEPGPNIFLSPLSASMALGMTMNGTVGETWEGMRDALAFADLSPDQINESYRSLIDLLANLDAHVEFTIANSVWARQGFPVLPSFYDIVRDYFDGEARELDFDDPRSADVINGWISDATNGRIDRGIDAITGADMMFLINAIYFKGDWRQQFDSGRTQRAPFHRADGTTVDVDMMNRTLTLPVVSDSRWTAGELSYGGGAFSMIVVVPRDGLSLDVLVRDLDAAAWADLVGRMHETQLEVFLPRFRLEYDTFLNDPLIDMGMDVAFSPAADFSALTPNPVCIQSSARRPSSKSTRRAPKPQPSPSSASVRRRPAHPRSARTGPSSSPSASDCPVPSSSWAPSATRASRKPPHPASPRHPADQRASVGHRTHEQAQAQAHGRTGLPCACVCPFPIQTRHPA